MNPILLQLQNDAARLAQAWHGMARLGKARGRNPETRFLPSFQIIRTALVWRRVWNCVLYNWATAPRLLLDGL